MPADFITPIVEHGLLSDHAYNVIRVSIIDGSLTPGERLVESQLARRLNISQAPMREALRKLSHEGLVTNIPRRGSFVTEVSQAEAEQARQVRGAIEELAARLIAGKLSSENSTQLRAIVTEMRVAATNQDIAGFRAHDGKFHRTVINASGNAYLPRIWLQIEPSFQALQIVGSPRFNGDWSEMAEAHQHLIDVLEAGDIEVAATNFRMHAQGKGSSLYSYEEGEVH